MRVCLFNGKGGVGRTTLALNLAGAVAARFPSWRVLVADCDPQGSALAWAALAEETPFTVGRSRSRGFDLEILDLAPRIPENGVLPSADLFVVPTLLDGVSFVVFLRTLAMLKEQGARPLTVANRVNLGRAEHRDRLQDPALRQAVSIRDRSSLASTYARGHTVFSYPSAQTHYQLARADIDGLVDRVLERLRGPARRAA